MSKLSLHLVSLLFVVIVAMASYASNPSETTVPHDQLRAFAETYWKIKQAYVDKVDDKVLLEGAINGMLQSLDPYSAYLNEDDLMDLQASSDGVYEGLGVEVIAENDKIKVVNTLENSPAERAGILINDQITRVDDVDVKKVGAEKAIDSMRGKAGEPIVLKIVRAGNIEPLNFNIKRETLEMKSVSIKPLRDGFWHVRISMFQRDTGFELVRLLRKNLGNEHLKGVVIDLRNNPGGVLRAAVDVADLLLEDGVIVSTEGRTFDSKQRFFANPGDDLERIPAVVLINNRSASASEIVAGALQDHGRALVIGTRSYGKGVVQSILPIQYNTAIKLTTSRYYTPDGRSIHGKGIEPDVAVKVENETQDQDLQMDHALELLNQQSHRNLSQRLSQK